MQRVNATQLIRSVGLTRRSLQTQLKNCEITDVTVLKGEPGVQGTYISYTDGRRLCQNLSLNTHPIDALLKDNKRPSEATPSSHPSKRRLSTEAAPSREEMKSPVASHDPSSARTRHPLLYSEVGANEVRRAPYPVE
jgi:hypothetical protein